MSSNQVSPAKSILEKLMKNFVTNCTNFPTFCFHEFKFQHTSTFSYDLETLLVDLWQHSHTVEIFKSKKTLHKKKFQFWNYQHFHFQPLHISAEEKKRNCLPELLLPFADSRYSPYDG